MGDTEEIQSTDMVEEHSPVKKRVVRIPALQLKATLLRKLSVDLQLGKGQNLGYLLIQVLEIH